MFPSRKLRSEAGEPGDGQGWRFGPIDLDAGVVEVHRIEPEPEPEPDERHGRRIGSDEGAVRPSGASAPWTRANPLAPGGTMDP
jgi:hypothetical protein